MSSTAGRCSNPRNRTSCKPTRGGCSTQSETHYCCENIWHVAQLHSKVTWPSLTHAADSGVKPGLAPLQLQGALTPRPRPALWHHLWAKQSAVTYRLNESPATSLHSHPTRPPERAATPPHPPHPAPTPSGSPSDSCPRSVSWQDPVLELRSALIIAIHRFKLNKAVFSFSSSILMIKGSFTWNADALVHTI